MKKIYLAAFLSILAAIGAQAQESAPASTLGILVQALSRSADPASQLNILRGINAAVKGKHGIAAPAGWAPLYEQLKTSANPELRQEAQSLALVFGGAGGAVEELRKTLADRTAAFEQRKAALESLVSVRDPASLLLILEASEEASPLRKPAIHALAAYDSAKVPEALLALYPTFSSEEKREALSTLVTRPAWAQALVAGIDSKVIAKSDVSTPLARQLQDLQDPEVAAWLAKNWGAMRSSPADKQQQIARLKSVLTPAFMAKGDAAHGRALFSQTCILCHTLFGAGAKIGPELPGAFEDIDYLLLNVIDPNAIIGKDYQQTIVQTKDGQTLVGIIAEQDASSVTLKSLAGLQTVQRSDLASLTVSETSLMPEGLLSAQKDEDVRDLFSYLRLHGQTPVLGSALNVNDFFNGADLTRWVPSRADSWRVDGGQIVGRGNGERAEFLTSDMVFENFRLTGKLRLAGNSASAEVSVRGQQTDGGFQGMAFRFGNTPLTLVRYATPSKPELLPAAEVQTIPPEEWTAFEVEAAGPELRISINGKPAFSAANTPGGDRSVIAFHVAGKDSELRVKDLHLELLPK